jgi:hypothetical protein
VSNDFEELLQDSMNWFTSAVQVPAGLASRTRRRRRRRQVAARAAIAAGTAAVSAAAVIAVTAGAGDAPGPRPGQPGNAQIAAYVLRRAEQAVKTRRLIFEVLTPQQTLTTRRPGRPPRTTYVPRSLQWTYRYGERLEVFGAYLRRHGEQGAANVDTESGPPRWTGRTLSPFTQTTVNYTSRTWSRGTQLTGRGQPWHGSACAVAKSMVDPQIAGEILFSSPTFIASALACGGFSEVGRSYVDGTAAIKLIGTPRLTRVPMSVYISPATYLLIRTNIGGMREDYRWLAPTRANRDLFKIHAPAGFRRVKVRPGT